MKVLVKFKEHRRFEDGQPKTYQVGEVFDATEAEVKAFGDKLEVVEEKNLTADNPQSGVAGDAESAEKKSKGKVKKESLPDTSPEAPIEASEGSSEDPQNQSPA